MGYWSLIAGPIAGRTANVGLTIYWRPVRFARPRWKQIAVPLRFGMHIAMQRIAGSIGNLSDSMVVAKTLGQSPLGVYRMSSSLASAPAEKIGALIMRATGPLFARVQHDRDLLRRYFLILSESLTIALFPLLFGLAAVASDAVHLLFKPEWEGMAEPLRWLAVYMAFRMLIYLMNQVLTTLRFTRFGMWMSIVSFVLMPVAFYVASPGVLARWPRPGF